MQVLNGLHLWQNPSTQFWILMLKALSERHNVGDTSNLKSILKCRFGWGNMFELFFRCHLQSQHWSRRRQTIALFRVHRCCMCVAYGSTGLRGKKILEAWNKMKQVWTCLNHVCDIQRRLLMLSQEICQTSHTSLMLLLFVWRYAKLRTTAHVKGRGELTKFQHDTDILWKGYEKDDYESPFLTMHW